MVPTVLGAWIGVSTGIMASHGRRPVGLILFLAGAFGFMFAIEKTKNSAAGVPAAAGLHVLHGPDAVAPDRRGARLGQRCQPGHDRLRRHGGGVLRHGQRCPR
jgi:hypothetical protein